MTMGGGKRNGRTTNRMDGWTSDIDTQQVTKQPLELNSLKHRMEPLVISSFFHCCVSFSVSCCAPVPLPCAACVACLLCLIYAFCVICLVLILPLCLCVAARRWFGFLLLPSY